MELTRTDDVFSRIAMVLFLCRNKSSRNDLKINRDYFWKILKILEEESTSGGPHPVHEGGGHACPPGRAPCLVGPLMLHRPQLQHYIFRFTKKKIREKDSSRCTIWICRQALNFSGEKIWSPFRAPKRGIRRHRHHQPSSITNFMMLTAVRE